MFRPFRAAAAAAVLAGAALHGSPVSAEEPPPEPVPCQPDDGLFRVSIEPITDRVHEIADGDRYHENSRLVALLTAVPVDADSQPRPGVTYAGRLVATHVANDGTAGTGHAVATVTLAVVARGDDGSTLRFRALGHIAATARPGTGGESIRVWFDRAVCG